MTRKPATKLLSPGGKKSFAYATAQLKLKISRESARTPDDGASERVMFEEAIDACPTLRRTSDATVVGDRYLVLRATVEYGPVFGCHPSDFDGPLARISEAFTGASIHVVEADVFNFIRHEVKRADVPAIIAKLTAAMDDEETSFAEQKAIDQKLTRLRQQFPAEAAAAETASASAEAEAKSDAVETAAEPIVAEPASINTELASELPSVEPMEPTEPASADAIPDITSESATEDAVEVK